MIMDGDDNDERSPLRGDDCKRPRPSLGIRKIVIIVLFLGSLAALAVGAIVSRYIHSTCYSILPPGPVVNTCSRSGAFSILYSTSSLTCSEKQITTKVVLHNEATFVEIYQSPCETIENTPFSDSYSWNNTRVSQPTPVFSEDFSKSQNYFISGRIRVDMVNITTVGSSPNIIKACLFTNIDDFQIFIAAGSNYWKHIKNAKCYSAQIKTDDSHTNSLTTTFNISKPTFAFVGIAATGNLYIGNLTITTSGVGLSGPGRNWTKKCQLNSKNTTCTFSLTNSMNREVCLIAHEEEHSDGSYGYSNFTIRLLLQINSPFWICIALSISLILVIALLPAMQATYKRWKKRRIAQPIDGELEHLIKPNPETQTDQSGSRVNISGNQSAAECVNHQSITKVHVPKQNSERLSEQLKTPIEETERTSTVTPSTLSPEQDSKSFNTPVSAENEDDPGQVVTPKSMTKHACTRLSSGSEREDDS